jgi:putative membrane protein
MIVRGRPSAWELVGIFRLSVLPKILPRIVGITVWSAAVAWAAGRWAGVFKAFGPAPFTLLGIALSIFLGFRNNVSYERWWEARRQLGALIGEVRSLARVTLTVHGGDSVRRVRVVRGLIGYTYALMGFLRGEAVSQDVRLYSEGLETTWRNVPDALLRGLGAEYGAMLAEGEFGEVVWQRVDERLAALAAIQVACERIKGTPVPFTYTLLLHRTAYAFLVMLPFGLVGMMGYWTPAFAAVVAYAFFGLDELAAEFEEPFGPWLNALPLHAMARTVEISLLEAMGEKFVPRALEPVDGVLR